MAKTKTSELDGAYLGEAEYEPVENPIDPDYAKRVAAADSLKIGPPQREIPNTTYEEIPADMVSTIMLAEQEKAIDAAVKSGDFDDVAVPVEVADLTPEDDG